MLSFELQKFKSGNHGPNNRALGKIPVTPQTLKAAAFLTGALVVAAAEAFGFGVWAGMWGLSRGLHDKAHDTYKNHFEANENDSDGHSNNKRAEYDRQHLRAQTQDWTTYMAKGYGSRGGFELLCV